MVPRQALVLLLAASFGCSSDLSQGSGDPDAAGTAVADAAPSPDGMLDAASDARGVDALPPPPVDAGDDPGADAGPTLAALETIAPPTATSGLKVPLRCELRDANGEVAPWPASLVATIEIGEPEIIEDQGKTVFVARKAGSTTVRCKAGSYVDTTPATVVVLPGTPATLTTLVSRTPVAADPADPGTDVTCVLEDAAGNVVPDDGKVTVVLAHPASGTVTARHVHFTLTGAQTVSCLRSGTTTTPAKVEVLPGRPAAIALAVSPDLALVQPGVTITAQVAVADSYGNAVDPSAAVVSSTPPASARPGPLQFRYDGVGAYVLEARITNGTVTGAPLVEVVEILVNDGAPSIECAARMIEIDGATHSWAATRVTGRVTDENGVKGVKVNGKAVTVDGGGNFATTVPSVFGVNSFQVVVTDGQDVTRERWCPYLAAERYQPENEPPEGSVVLALGPDAIDDHTAGALAGSLGDVVDRALTPQQLGDILHSYLNVGDRKLGRDCVLVIFCVDVYYNPTKHRVSVATGNIDLDLAAAGIHTFLEATTFRLGITSEGIVGLASSTGIASVDYASVDADFHIGAVGGLLDGTYLEGSLDTSFHGLGVDTNNFLVDLVVLIFPSLIDKVLDQVIQDLMAKIVDDLLHAIKVETFGISVVLPRLDGSGDVTVSAAGTFAEADANATRLRGSIAPVFIVAGGTPHAKASLGIAIQGGAITEPSVPLAGRSIALGLHAEAVNDLVHGLWRHGFFEGRIDPEALEAFGVDLGGLEELFETFDLSLSSPLPAVVELRPGGKLRFGVAGMRTILRIPVSTTPLEVEVTGLFEGTAALAGGRITLADVSTVSLHVTTVTLPKDVDTTTIDQFDMLATRLIETILVEVLSRSLLGIPVPELHLPTEIGPLTLPAPITLGLDDPDLSVSSPHLLIQSELLERP